MTSPLIWTLFQPMLGYLKQLQNIQDNCLVGNMPSIIKFNRQERVSTVNFVQANVLLVIRSHSNTNRQIYINYKYKYTIQIDTNFHILYIRYQVSIRRKWIDSNRARLNEKYLCYRPANEIVNPSKIHNNGIIIAWNDGNHFCKG